MLPRILLSFVLLLAVSLSAKANLEVCNQTIENVSLAKALFISPNSDDLRVEGWWIIKPEACTSISANYPEQSFYMVHVRFRNGNNWKPTTPLNNNSEAGELKLDLCVRSQSFTILDKDKCPDGYDVGPFHMIFAPARLGKRTMKVTREGFNIPEIVKGTIQEKCLISWDDSHQVHSVKQHLTWNRQVVRTRMKKLRHCINLKVQGPVDISGVAKAYVDQCINSALNDSKTEYLIRAVIALGADVLGSSGAASAANVLAYIDHVKSSAISCLTNSDRIKAYMQRYVADKFNASVGKESHWIYWNL